MWSSKFAKRSSQPRINRTRFWKRTNCNSCLVQRSLTCWRNISHLTFSVYSLNFSRRHFVAPLLLHGKSYSLKPHNDQKRHSRPKMHPRRRKLHSTPPTAPSPTWRSSLSFSLKLLVFDSLKSEVGSSCLHMHMVKGLISLISCCGSFLASAIQV